MKTVILICLAFILLTATASAITITTSSNELKFENILDYGYAERTIKITSDSTEPLLISLSATEPIREWLSFEPESSYASLGNPAEFKIIVKPVNALLGIYQGYVIINARSGGNKLTASVATATDLKTAIMITDEEVSQVNVEEVIVKDIEAGNALKVSILLENKGNMPMLPFFEIDILDVNKSNVLQSFTSEGRTLPSSSLGLIENEISNNLPVGKYFARIKVHANGSILREQLSSFLVVEPGKMPVKEEPMIKVQPMPITLGANWIVLTGWALILVFVIWTIKKSRSGKKKKR